MIFVYLKEDYSGASSRFDYGKKGDAVVIIERNINMVRVINDRGLEFWLNENRLSTEKIKRDEPTKNKISTVVSKKSKR